MSHCLNPNCQKPQNQAGTKFCLTCGTKLLLKERYRATSFLGAGGMGRNFLAVDEDTPSRKRCVIKQFAPHPDIISSQTAFQKAVELFNREAALLDQLGDESAQIPKLLAYLEQDQRLYFVQEFIDGQNLLQELEQQGTYNEAQIYQLLNDLLPVLKFIHQRGVIHRDIKPENIMRRFNGQLVLIDFGISKELSGTVMAMGTTVGTLGYAPPEQMTYGIAYPASDIYAIGTTCIHLATDIFPNQLFDPLKNRWLWRDTLVSRCVVFNERLMQLLDKMLMDDLGERWRLVDDVLADLNPQQKTQVNSEDDYSKGIKNAQKGKYREAINDFTQALRINPYYGAAYKYRAIAYTRLAENQAAITDFQKAAHYYWQLRETRNHLDVIERLKSLWRDILISRGIVFTEEVKQVLDEILIDELGEQWLSFDEVLAIINSKQETQTNPNNYYSKGIKNAQKGNYKEAINDLTQALRINAYYPATYKYRAMAYTRLADNKAAIADFQKAAHLYLQQGDTANYQDVLERIQTIKSLYTTGSGK